MNDIKIIVGILFIIKLVLSIEYVDLKNNYITSNVIVHHGNFMEHGKYKMFVGDEVPLELVQYGHIRVYPDLEYKAGSHRLMVELFDNGDNQIIIINVFVLLNNVIHDNYKLYFELKEFSYVQIDYNRMFAVIKGGVNLSVDISSKHVHPFISITIQAGEHAYYLYRIKKYYNTMRLNINESKIYSFGKIYDSSRRIVFGYSKIDSFVKRCNGFDVEKSSDDNHKIMIKSAMNVIEYERKGITGKVIWYPNIYPQTLLNEEQKKAMQIRDRVDNVHEKFESVTLDISENMTPELSGIQMVKGKVGVWNYTLFELDNEHLSSEKIKYVIDSRIKIMKIAAISEDSVYTFVELFNNTVKNYVFVTSIIRNEFGYEKELRIFDKAFDNEVVYAEQLHQQKKDVINYVERSYPIKLKIVVDEPPTRIMEYGTLHFANGNFSFYKIKEGMNFGTDLQKKYIIDELWERDLNEEGNIPMEQCKTKYKVVRIRVNSNKVILTDVSSDIPIQGTEFESYEIIKKN